MSGRKPKQTIRGEWLRVALEAANVSAHELAKHEGLQPDKYYRHFSDKAHLSAESLATLCRLIPTLNLRYILTGEGPPVL